MRATCLCVLAMLLAGACEANTTLQFTYPTREAGAYRCDDSVCVRSEPDSVLYNGGWWKYDRCVEMGLTPLVGPNELWRLNLWVTTLTGASVLKRSRRIAPGMAGLTDTVNVATEDAMNTTAWITVSDSTGNTSCRSNLVALFNGSADTRVGVGSGSGPPGLATMHRAPYTAPKGAVLYDLSGRKITEATTTGLYWLVGPGWSRKVVVVR